ncbi:unnamed protein product [Ectocarpus fasciculatus]
MHPLGVCVPVATQQQCLLMRPLGVCAPFASQQQCHSAVDCRELIQICKVVHAGVAQCRQYWSMKSKPCGPTGCSILGVGARRLLIASSLPCLTISPVLCCRMPSSVSCTANCPMYSKRRSLALLGYVNGRV